MTERVFNPEAVAAAEDKKTREGEWRECLRSGCRVLMRPSTYEPFMMKKMSLEKQYRAQNPAFSGRNVGKDLPVRAQRDINLRAIAEELLIGWDRIVTPDGTAIPFSSEQAFTFLKAENLIPFRMDVMEHVNASAEVETDELEELEGNS